MSQVISVSIPIRTRSEANVREHWRVKARRAKEQRRVTGRMVTAALRKAGHKRLMLSQGCPQDLEMIGVSFTRKSPRRLDSDNLQRALKAIRDGVADALGLDDADSSIAWAYDQEIDKEYGVDIEVDIQKAVKRC